MLALIAFLPILATLILMMVFNWPAKWSLLVSWVMGAALTAMLYRKGAWKRKAEHMGLTME